jgi:hypothetical protein
MSDPDLKVLLFSEMCDRMMHLSVDGHASAAPFIDGKIYHVLISLLANTTLKVTKKKI